MKILIGGDFCPENRAEILLSKGEQIFSIKYRSIWDSADFRIVNLEGPITGSGLKIDKVGRHIRFNPDIMKGIKAMNVTHFSLANNHIMDYGTQGITDTIQYLNQSKVNYFGCHEQAISLLEKNNLQVGVLSFSNKEFSLLENNQGIGACSMDLITMLQKIEAVRKVTSHIIVILHTGLSKYPLPSPEQRRLCRFLIDNGASAVLCQHSHIMGAYESYNNGFISYGQGSFVFELNRKNTLWNKGYSVEFNFENNKQLVNIIPHRQFDDELNIRTLSEAENQEFDELMLKLNQILTDDVLFEKAWQDYLMKVEKYYFNQFFLSGNRIIRKIINLINFKFFLSKNKKNIILNNIRNDEHVEVLKDLLQRG